MSTVSIWRKAKATTIEAVLQDLKALCDQGVESLACGACRADCELRDRVAVGEGSEMHAIAEMVLAAGRAITLRKGEM